MATLAKHSKAPKFPMLLSQIINFFKIVGRTDKTQSAPLALCHCHRPRSAILASNLFDLIWGKKIRHKVIKRAKLKVWLDDLESYELPLQSRGNHPSSTFILGESIFVIKQNRGRGPRPTQEENFYGFFSAVEITRKNKMILPFFFLAQYEFLSLYFRPCPFLGKFSCTQTSTYLRMYYMSMMELT